MCLLLSYMFSQLILKTVVKHRLSQPREDTWGRTETPSRPPDSKACVRPSAPQKLRHMSSVRSHPHSKSVSLGTTIATYLLPGSCAIFPATKCPGSGALFKQYLNKRSEFIFFFFFFRFHHLIPPFKNQIYVAIWQHNKSTSKNLLVDSCIR